MLHKHGLLSSLRIKKQIMLNCLQKKVQSESESLMQWKLHVWFGADYFKLKTRVRYFIKF